MKLTKIPNYGNYLLSEEGDLFVKKKNGMVVRKAIRLDKDGYPRSTLFKESKRWDATIHILMAITFIGEIPEGYEVNHIDGNKLNTHYSNFEIIPKKENMKHNLNVLKNCKLDFETAKEIRALANMGVWSNVELGEIYGVSNQTVSLIKLNRIWKEEYHA